MTFSRTSELQSVEYVTECFNYAIYLTWLNSLGGWEYWLFDGEKDYTIDIEEDIIAKKNLFENWDSDFINEETELFFSSVRAFNEKTIRSGQLTKQQADAIAKIKHSIQVQEIDASDNKVTVLVDKGNIRIRRDGDLFSELSFNIRETSEIPIQQQ